MQIYSYHLNLQLFRNSCIPVFVIIDIQFGVKQVYKFLMIFYRQDTQGKVWKPLSVVGYNEHNNVNFLGCKYIDGQVTDLWGKIPFQAERETASNAQTT